jgi:DNA polymerase-1
MRHLIYADTPQAEYPLCFLVPTINKDGIKKEYLDPFGIPDDDVIVFDLHYSQASKKTPVKEIKEFIESELVSTLTDAKVQYIVTSDSDYFKVLTKSQKTEANLGYVLDCVFGPWKVIYVPSYRAVFYDPIKNRAKIKQGMNALLSHVTGNYQDPGSGIIKKELYPKTPKEIEAALNMLLQMNCDLTCDIEAFDLKHHRAGIGTITFCWNEHEGIAFPVDYEEIPGATEAPFGREVYNATVRKLLLNFFTKFQKKMIYHNISFDVYVMIYQLFMGDLLDTEGLLNGMDYLLTNWDDTKLISYVATNSCAGNKLGLKDQAQEYSGNYAVEEIKDIRRIKLGDLLRYNLVDGLSTWFVYKKHYPTMVKDDQLEIYETLFKPAIRDIIQMQLTGLPVNMKTVKRVKVTMEDDQSRALATMRGTKVVKQFTYRLNEKYVEKKNAEYKKKRITLADAKEVFNPNSNPQLQDMLFGMLGLPILSTTDSGQPSTDGDTLKNLLNHTKDPDTLAFLNAMLDYSAVNKILTSFIPALENAAEGPDGWHYLFGNFNLGGTVSGRLSSSDPNLQNLPANSKYAKLIKSCIEAPPGWVFCGLDFASLEDRISALTTKDPEKLKVYTDGFDGHAMRAFAYWGDQMPGIQNTVQSINSMAEKTHAYYHFRQDSKAPTFALTYQGTFKTLMVNCGFSKEKAQAVEAAFKNLYKVSIEWVSGKLDKAAQDGYVTAAFGLRVRTPLLAQVIRGNRSTPHEAEAEGRTAGNALGQSWCLLNTRASAAFMKKVRDSKHRLDIKPCAHIHDAQYMLVKDDIKAIAFANRHLVEEVQWQDHPEIWHDEVKLGGEFGIFYPTWGKEITIANGATEDEILDTISKALAA